MTPQDIPYAELVAQATQQINAPTNMAPNQFVPPQNIMPPGFEGLPRGYPGSGGIRAPGMAEGAMPPGFSEALHQRVIDPTIPIETARLPEAAYQARTPEEQQLGIKSPVVPGQTPYLPLQTEAPSVPWAERTRAMNLSMTPEGMAEHFRRLGFNARTMPHDIYSEHHHPMLSEMTMGEGYNITIQEPTTGEWHVLDPQSFEMKDLTDIITDAAITVTSIKGANAAARAALTKRTGAATAAQQAAIKSRGGAAAREAQGGILDRAGKDPRFAQMVGQDIGFAARTADPALARTAQAAAMEAQKPSTFLGARLRGSVFPGAWPEVPRQILAGEVTGMPEEGMGRRIGRGGMELIASALGELIDPVQGVRGLLGSRGRGQIDAWLKAFNRGDPDEKLMAMPLPEAAQRIARGNWDTGELYQPKVEAGGRPPEDPPPPKDPSKDPAEEADETIEEGPTIDTSEEWSHVAPGDFPLKRTEGPGYGGEIGPAQQMGRRPRTAPDDASAKGPEGPDDVVEQHPQVAAEIERIEADYRSEEVIEDYRSYDETDLLDKHAEYVGRVNKRPPSLDVTHPDGKIHFSDEWVSHQRNIAQLKAIEDVLNEKQIGFEPATGYDYGGRRSPSEDPAVTLAKAEELAAEYRAQAAKYRDYPPHHKLNDKPYPELAEELEASADEVLRIAREHTEEERPYLHYTDSLQERLERELDTVEAAKIRKELARRKGGGRKGGGRKGGGDEFETRDISPIRQEFEEAFEKATGRKLTEDQREFLGASSRATKEHGIAPAKEIAENVPTPGNTKRSDHGALRKITAKHGEAVGEGRPTADEGTYRGKLKALLKADKDISPELRAYREGVLGELEHIDPQDPVYIEAVGKLGKEFKSGSTIASLAAAEKKETSRLVIGPEPLFLNSKHVAAVLDGADGAEAKKALDRFDWEDIVFEVDNWDRDGAAGLVKKLQDLKGDEAKWAELPGASDNEKAIRWMASDDSGGIAPDLSMKSATDAYKNGNMVVFVKGSESAKGAKARGEGGPGLRNRYQEIPIDGVEIIGRRIIAPEAQRPGSTRPIGAVAELEREAMMMGEFARSPTRELEEGEIARLAGKEATIETELGAGEGQTRAQTLQKRLEVIQRRIAKTEEGVGGEERVRVKREKAIERKRKALETPTARAKKNLKRLTDLRKSEGIPEEAAAAGARPYTITRYGTKKYTYTKAELDEMVAYARKIISGEIDEATLTATDRQDLWRILMAEVYESGTRKPTSSPIKVATTTTYKDNVARTPPDIYTTQRAPTVAQVKGFEAAVVKRMLSDKYQLPVGRGDLKSYENPATGMTREKVYELLGGRGHPQLKKAGDAEMESGIEAVIFTFQHGRVPLNWDIRPYQPHVNEAVTQGVVVDYILKDLMHSKAIKEGEISLKELLGELSIKARPGEGDFKRLRGHIQDVMAMWRTAEPDTRQARAEEMTKAFLDPAHETGKFRANTGNFEELDLVYKGDGFEKRLFKGDTDGEQTWDKGGARNYEFDRPAHPRSQEEIDEIIDSAKGRVENALRTEMEQQPNGVSVDDIQRLEGVHKEIEEAIVQLGRHHPRLDADSIMGAVRLDPADAQRFTDAWDFDAQYVRIEVTDAIAREIGDLDRVGDEILRSTYERLAHARKLEGIENFDEVSKKAFKELGSKIEKGDPELRNRLDYLGYSEGERAALTKEEAWIRANYGIRKGNKLPTGKEAPAPAPAPSGKPQADDTGTAKPGDTGSPKADDGGTKSPEERIKNYEDTLAKLSEEGGAENIDTVRDFYRAVVDKAQWRYVDVDQDRHLPKNAAHIIEDGLKAMKKKKVTEDDAWEVFKGHWNKTDGADPEPTVPPWINKKTTGMDEIEWKNKIKEIWAEEPPRGGDGGGDTPGRTPPDDWSDAEKAEYTGAPDPKNEKEFVAYMGNVKSDRVYKKLYEDVPEAKAELRAEFSERVEEIEYGAYTGVSGVETVPTTVRWRHAGVRETKARKTWGERLKNAAMIMRVKSKKAFPSVFGKPWEEDAPVHILTTLGGHRSGASIRHYLAGETGLDIPGEVLYHVHEGSPAFAAGLKSGDVVYNIDGKKVTGAAGYGEFNAAYAKHAADGTDMTVKWLVAGEKKTLGEATFKPLKPVEPGAMPKSEVQRFLRQQRVEDVEIRKDAIAQVEVTDERRISIDLVLASGLNVKSGIGFARQVDKVVRPLGQARIRFLKVEDPALAQPYREDPLVNETVYLNMRPDEKKNGEVVLAITNDIPISPSGGGKYLIVRSPGKKPGDPMTFREVNNLKGVTSTELIDLIENPWAQVALPQEIRTARLSGSLDTLIEVDRLFRKRMTTKTQYKNLAKPTTADPTPNMRLRKAIMGDTKLGHHDYDQKNYEVLRQRAILATQYDSGLRAEGIRELTIEGVGGRFDEATGKWTFSEAHMKNPTTKIIKEYLDARGEIYGKAAWGEIEDGTKHITLTDDTKVTGNFLFVNKTTASHPLGKGKVNELVKNIAKLDLPKEKHGDIPSSHRFRHSIAEWMMEQGAHENMVTELLGHVRGGDTWEKYVKSPRHAFATPHGTPATRATGPYTVTDASRLAREGGTMKIPKEHLEAGEAPTQVSLSYEQTFTLWKAIDQALGVKGRPIVNRRNNAIVKLGGTTGLRRQELADYTLGDFRKMRKAFDDAGENHPAIDAIDDYIEMFRHEALTKALLVTTKEGREHTTGTPWLKSLGYKDISAFKKAMDADNWKIFRSTQGGRPGAKTGKVAPWGSEINESTVGSVVPWARKLAKNLDPNFPEKATTHSLRHSYFNQMLDQQGKAQRLIDLLEGPEAKGDYAPPKPPPAVRTKPSKAPTEDAGPSAGEAPGRAPEPPPADPEAGPTKPTKPAKPAKPAEPKKPAEPQKTAEEMGRDEEHAELMGLAREKMLQVEEIRAAKVTAEGSKLAMLSKREIGLISEINDIRVKAEELVSGKPKAKAKTKTKTKTEKKAKPKFKTKADKASEQRVKVAAADAKAFEEQHPGKFNSAGARSTLNKLSRQELNVEALESNKTISLFEGKTDKPAFGKGDLKEFRAKLTKLEKPGVFTDSTGKQSAVKLITDEEVAAFTKEVRDRIVLNAERRKITEGADEIFESSAVSEPNRLHDAKKLKKNKVYVFDKSASGGDQQLVKVEKRGNELDWRDVRVGDKFVIRTFETEAGGGTPITGKAALAGKDLFEVGKVVGLGKGKDNVGNPGDFVWVQRQGSSTAGGAFFFPEKKGGIKIVKHMRKATKKGPEKSPVYGAEWGEVLGRVEVVKASDMPAPKGKGLVGKIVEAVDEAAGGGKAMRAGVGGVLEAFVDKALEKAGSFIGANATGVWRRITKGQKVRKVQLINELKEAGVPGAEKAVRDLPDELFLSPKSGEEVAKEGISRVARAELAEQRHARLDWSELSSEEKFESISAFDVEHQAEASVLRRLAPTEEVVDRRRALIHRLEARKKNLRDLRKELKAESPGHELIDGGNDSVISKKLNTFGIRIRQQKQILADDLGKVLNLKSGKMEEQQSVKAALSRLKKQLSPTAEAAIKDLQARLDNVRVVSSKRTFRRGGTDLSIRRGHIIYRLREAVPKGKEIVTSGNWYRIERGSPDYLARKKFGYENLELLGGDPLGRTKFHPDEEGMKELIATVHYINRGTDADFVSHKIVHPVAPGKEVMPLTVGERRLRAGASVERVKLIVGGEGSEAGGLIRSEKVHTGPQAGRRMGGSDEDLPPHVREMGTPALGDRRIKEELKQTFSASQEGMGEYFRIIGKRGEPTWYRASDDAVKRVKQGFLPGPDDKVTHLSTPSKKILNDRYSASMGKSPVEPHMRTMAPADAPPRAPWSMSFDEFDKAVTPKHKTALPGFKISGWGASTAIKTEAINKGSVGVTINFPGFRHTIEELDISPLLERYKGLDVRAKISKTDIKRLAWQKLLDPEYRKSVDVEAEFLPIEEKSLTQFGTSDEYKAHIISNEIAAMDRQGTLPPGPDSGPLAQRLPTTGKEKAKRPPGGGGEAFTTMNVRYEGLMASAPKDVNEAIRLGVKVRGDYMKYEGHGLLSPKAREALMKENGKLVKDELKALRLLDKNGNLTDQGALKLRRWHGMQVERDRVIKGAVDTVEEEFSRKLAAAIREGITVKKFREQDIAPALRKYAEEEGHRVTYYEPGFIKAEDIDKVRTSPAKSGSDEKKHRTEAYIEVGMPPLKGQTRVKERFTWDVEANTWVADGTFKRPGLFSTEKGMTIDEVVWGLKALGDKDLKVRDSIYNHLPALRELQFSPRIAPESPTGGQIERNILPEIETPPPVSDKTAVGKDDYVAITMYRDGHHEYAVFGSYSAAKDYQFAPVNIPGTKVSPLYKEGTDDLNHLNLVTVVERGRKNLNIGKIKEGREAYTKGAAGVSSKREAWQGPGAKIAVALARINQINNTHAILVKKLADYPRVAPSEGWFVPSWKPGMAGKIRYLSGETHHIKAGGDFSELSYKRQISQGGAKGQELPQRHLRPKWDKTATGWIEVRTRGEVADAVSHIEEKALFDAVDDYYEHIELNPGTRHEVGDPSYIGTGSRMDEAAKRRAAAKAHGGQELMRQTAKIRARSKRPSGSRMKPGGGGKAVGKVLLGGALTYLASKAGIDPASVGVGIGSVGMILNDISVPSNLARTLKEVAADLGTDIRQLFTKAGDRIGKLSTTAREKLLTKGIDPEALARGEGIKPVQSQKRSRLFSQKVGEVGGKKILADLHRDIGEEALSTDNFMVGNAPGTMRGQFGAGEVNLRRLVGGKEEIGKQKDAHGSLDNIVRVLIGAGDEVDLTTRGGAPYRENIKEFNDLQDLIIDTLEGLDYKVTKVKYLGEKTPTSKGGSTLEDWHGVRHEMKHVTHRGLFVSKEGLRDEADVLGLISKKYAAPRQEGWDQAGAVYRVEAESVLDQLDDKYREAFIRWWVAKDGAVTHGADAAGPIRVNEKFWEQAYEYATGSALTTMGKKKKFLRNYGKHPIVPEADRLQGLKTATEIEALVEGRAKAGLRHDIGYVEPKELGEALAITSEDMKKIRSVKRQLDTKKTLASDTEGLSPQLQEKVDEVMSIPQRSDIPEAREFTALVRLLDDPIEYMDGETRKLKEFYWDDLGKSGQDKIIRQLLGETKKSLKEFLATPDGSAFQNKLMRLSGAIQERSKIGGLSNFWWNWRMLRSFWGGSSFSGFGRTFWRVRQAKFLAGNFSKIVKDLASEPTRARARELFAAHPEAIARLPDSIKRQLGLPPFEKEYAQAHGGALLTKKAMNWLRGESGVSFPGQAAPEDKPSGVVGRLIGTAGGESVGRRLGLTRLRDRPLIQEGLLKEQSRWEREEKKEKRKVRRLPRKLQPR